MLSLDDDFERLHYRWLEQDRTHNGIIFGRSKLQGQGGIGVIVKFIAQYADDVIGMSLLENELIEIE